MPGQIIDRGFARAAEAGLLKPRLPGMPSPGGSPLGHAPPLMMLPSAELPLHRILFTLPPAVLEDNDEPVRKKMEAAYLSLLRQLPSHCEIVVLSDPTTVANADDWLNLAGVHGRATVVQSPPGLAFTMWAADPFWTCIATSGAQRHHLVEPLVFPREQDALVARALLMPLQYHSRRIASIFEGGNLLVGDEFWLIGVDSLRGVQNTPSAVRAAYRDMEAERTPIVIEAPSPPIPPWVEGLPGRDLRAMLPARRPHSRQPIFHIDMFITLVGKSEVDGRYIVLVGDPSLATKELGHKTWPDDVHPDPSKQAQFDAIADSFDPAKFEVIRNPLPLIYEDDVRPGHNERHYYFASANNAIVQRAPKRVWLPTYADEAWPELGKTDAANAKIWQKLHFEVHTLGDFNPFAFSGGAANCIKNVLARGLL